MDIDDTLAATDECWAEELLKFKNPEHLDAEELVRRYRYAKNVPYFDGWMREGIEQQVQSAEAKLH